MTAADAADWPARLRELAVRVRVDVAQRGQPADVPLASALADVLETRADLSEFGVAASLPDAVDRLAEVLAAAMDTTTDDTDEGTAP